jgi:hypothetical protein
MDSQPRTCRHAVNGCSGVAVAEVRCPSGCVAFPADRRQWLCAQHVISGLQGHDDMSVLRAAPGVTRANYPGIW